MANLSQRSVALMIRIFHQLGCYDDTSYTGIYPAPLSATDLKRDLYARDFAREFLETCARSRWNFDSILPQLHDGRFFNPAPQGRNWRARLEYEGAASQQQEAVEKGREILLNFAEYLFEKVPTLPEANEFRDELIELLTSLELDGLRLHLGKLIASDTAIFDQPKQVSLLIHQIQTSKLASEQTLLHHFTNGEQEYLGGKFDIAVGEWRKFLEGLLRGIAEETRRHRPDLKKDAAKLTMKDLFLFLEESGFLDSDERLAFSSSWAFLCSGAHPGIGNKDQAHLAMILSLSFGHIALSKFEAWKQHGYKGF